MKRAATQKRYEATASASLAQFGFTIKQPSLGMTRYGTGKGGIKLEHARTRDDSFGIGQVDDFDAVRVWVDDPRCSAQQLDVLDRVRRGENVFFTGSAGVGKSFLLHESVHYSPSPAPSVFRSQSPHLPFGLFFGLL